MLSPEINRVSLKAILLSYQASEPDIQIQNIIWQLDKEMLLNPLVTESSPGVNNLLIQVIDASHIGPMIDTLKTALFSSQQNASQAKPRREIRIPVIYGGRFGPDLAQLCSHSGLKKEDVIKLHSSATYDAICLGAHAGFAYLSGLNPLIHMPRKHTPSLSVSRGAVIIGGAQAGVMASTLPSGWNIIGQTDAVLFDLQRKGLTLIELGDTVKFDIVDILND